jgi:lipoprotein-releasing system ATP-binding protein
MIISIKDVSKSYFINGTKNIILNNINFHVLKGDIISISGPSGSGKSSLLNILGLLDFDFNGKYIFLNNDVNSLKSSEKNKIRNVSIGFVHQFFHLIPELNVLENVSLPNMINNNNSIVSLNKSKEMLINFGLKDRMFSKPVNLSGGEKQRVAIARSLINNPDLIIADEMTGNLDEKTADLVFNFFLEKVKIKKQTLIYVTHNNRYAKMANKMYQLSHQKLIQT